MEDMEAKGTYRAVRLSMHHAAGHLSLLFFWSWLLQINLFLIIVVVFIFIVLLVVAEASVVGTLKIVYRFRENFVGKGNTQLLAGTMNTGRTGFRWI